MNGHGQEQTKRVFPQRLMVAVFLLCALTVLGLLIFRERPNSTQQPVQVEQITFQGKDAEYWHSQCASSDRATRRAAQVRLIEAGTNAVPVLCSLLGSDDESVRQQAEQSLGAIGARAVPDILGFLKDGNADVRLHVARLLASLQPQTTEAAQALAAALDDQDDRVVATAAFALASMREHAAPAIRALSKALGHGNPPIRIMSAEALAAIGPDAASAIPDLIRCLDDTDVGVRRSAIQAIGHIGPPAALAATDRLVELLTSEEPYVRMAAATALGSIGPAAEVAIPVLKTIQSDPTVSAEAEWAIAQIEGDQHESLNPYAIQTKTSGLAISAPGEESPVDWPVLAGRPHRNAAVETSVPTDWNLELGTNVLWQVPLGNVSFAGPSVVAGKVFIGTDNGMNRLDSPTKRQGVLAAFSVDEGTFLWQDNAPFLEDRGLGSTLQEYTTSTPLIEGDRLYYITSQAQIRCLDVEAFTDDENDGPWTADTAMGPHFADILWELDMGAQLGVYPHEAPNCAVVSVGDLLMVCTSNGVDAAHTGIPAPRAPSFVGIDKYSGSVVWQVVGPSPRVLHGQWSSPAVGRFNDRPVVFFGGGDGWLYALDPATGRELWRYDGNPKDAVWRPSSDSGEAVFRNNIIACPVFHQGNVLLTMGQDPSHGDGQGLLHRIRCGGTGDVTSSHRVWQNRDVRRTIASPIVHEGLVYVGDNYGQVHCLDWATGEQVWMHDQMGRIWGCMVLAEDALYVGDEDGKLTIYRAGRKKEIINEFQFPAALYSMPAVAQHTMYIATSKVLYAIRQENDQR